MESSKYRRPWALRKMKEHTLPADQLRTIDDKAERQLRALERQTRPEDDPAIVLTDRGFTCRQKMLSSKKVRQLKRAQLIEHQLMEEQIRDVDTLTEREKSLIFKQLGIESRGNHSLATTAIALETPNTFRDASDYFSFMSQQQLNSKSHSVSSVNTSSRSSVAKSSKEDVTAPPFQLGFIPKKKTKKQQQIEAEHALRLQYTTFARHVTDGKQMAGAEAMQLFDAKNISASRELARQAAEQQADDVEWQECELRQLAVDVGKYVNEIISVPAYTNGPSGQSNDSSSTELDQAATKHHGSTPKMEEADFEQLFRDCSPMQMLRGKKNSEGGLKKKVVLEANPPETLLTSLRKDFGLEIKDYEKLKLQKEQEKRRKVDTLKMLYDQQQQRNFDDSLQKRITTKDLIDLVANAKSNLRNAIRAPEKEDANHYQASSSKKSQASTDSNLEQKGVLLLNLRKFMVL
jgi:hypothetical protein